MGSIVHKPSNVVFWHLRQLLLKYTFETSKDDKTLSRVVIVHNAELYLPVALFRDGRLIYVVSSRSDNLSAPLPSQGMEQLLASFQAQVSLYVISGP